MKHSQKQQQAGLKTIINKHFLLLTFLPLFLIFYIVKKMNMNKKIDEIDFYINSFY